MSESAFKGFEFGDPIKVQFLIALTRLGRKVYEGTVPEKVKARRRAKNRAARVARRNNR